MADVKIHSTTILDQNNYKECSEENIIQGCMF